MSTNTENRNSDLTDIGAFWKKEKNGKTFLSGKVKIGSNDYTAFIFKNNKTKPNQPDYRLVLSELEEALKPSSAKDGGGKASKPQNDEVESNNDDIPF
jgi:hypothetical protein